MASPLPSFAVYEAVVSLHYTLKNEKKLHANVQLFGKYFLNF